MSKDKIPVVERYQKVVMNPDEHGKRIIEFRGTGNALVGKWCRSDQVQALQSYAEKVTDELDNIQQQSDRFLLKIKELQIASVKVNKQLDRAVKRIEELIKDRNRYRNFSHTIGNPLICDGCGCLYNLGWGCQECGLYNTDPEAMQPLKEKD